MNLLPKTSENFSQKEYWETFFKKRGSKAFEWYGEYQELCEYIHKYINKTDDILMVGCGNSTLSMDMYDAGFDQMNNIDISETVIRQMVKLNKNKRPNMKYTLMNALSMTFINDSFQVTFDKGTLDALMTDDTPEAVERAENLFKEISRVTKGKYICVSLLQEHILRKLTSYFIANKWNIRIERCLAAEQKAIDRGEIGMPVFVIICTKTKKKDPILELCISGEINKIKTIDELISSILTMQQAVQIISGLNHNTISDHDEIFFELFKPGDNSCPRYTIYVLDKEYKRKHGQYAAFIVPQGREPEWLFSTKEGRKKLLASAGHNRLAIVTLHRGQKYNNLEQVKEELNDHIRNLAPPGLKTQISYLSLGSEVGQRDVKYKGTSDFSGPFIIEDVAGENNEVFRRLIFLNSQNIIQSEAKLKNVKTGRRGKKKLIVDLSYTACDHHIYMGLGAYTSCSEERGDIAVIGLGGGALCMFIQQLIPHSNITAVDIDPAMLQIATEWFGLVQNDKLSIKIEDGLKFLENGAKNGEKYNAILFDVDSKDTSLGMSCPPKEFLEPNVLQNIKKLLGDQGLFILNLVIRDENLRPDILKTIKTNFNTMISYKIDDDLNEIFYCIPKPVDKKIFVEKYSRSIVHLNNLCQKNKVQNDKIEMEEMMDALKIN